MLRIRAYGYRYWIVQRLTWWWPVWTIQKLWRSTGQFTSERTWLFGTTTEALEAVRYTRELSARRKATEKAARIRERTTKKIYL